MSNIFRKFFQYLQIDIHRLVQDDSAILVARTASIAKIKGQKETRFLVIDSDDAIQQHHAQGAFYEQDILDFVSRYIPSSATVVDVGANVGNHSIYFAQHLNASYVIAFEPMRLQHAILSINVLLNDLKDIVEVHKLALSDRSGMVRMITPNAKNLGRSMIAEESVYGEWIRTAIGDDVIGDKTVDFLKIDVEGHEMKALIGLSNTIHKNRPVILIEVNNENSENFAVWMQKNEYEIKGRFQHYAENVDFLIMPKKLASQN